MSLKHSADVHLRDEESIEIAFEATGGRGVLQALVHRADMKPDARDDSSEVVASSDRKCIVIESRCAHFVVALVRESKVERATTVQGPGTQNVRMTLLGY